MNVIMDDKHVSEQGLDSVEVTDDVNCVQEGNKRVSSRKRKPNSKYSEDSFVNYELSKTKKDFDGSTDEAGNVSEEMKIVSSRKKKPKPKYNKDDDILIKELLKKDSKGKKQVSSQKRKKKSYFSEDSELIPNEKKGILLRKRNLKTNYIESEEENVSDYSSDTMEKIGIDENTPAKNNPRKVVGKIKAKKDPFQRNYEKIRTQKLTREQYPPPDGMLSQLYVAAKDPTKGYTVLSSLFSFFKNHRNSISQGPKRSFVPEISDVEGVKETRSKFESGIIVRETNGGDYNDEKSGEGYTPTSVILFFADEDSVPTKSDLHHIFDCYGPLNKVNTEVVKRLKRARVVFKRRSDADMAFKSTGRFSIFGPSLVSYRLSYFY